MFRRHSFPSVSNSSPAIKSSLELVVQLKKMLRAGIHNCSDKAWDDLHTLFNNFQLNLIVLPPYVLQKFSLEESELNGIIIKRSDLNCFEILTFNDFRQSLLSAGNPFEVANVNETISLAILGTTIFLNKHIPEYHMEAPIR